MDEFSYWPSFWLQQASKDWQKFLVTSFTWAFHAAQQAHAALWLLSPQILSGTHFAPFWPRSLPLPPVITWSPFTEDSGLSFLPQNPLIASASVLSPSTASCLPVLWNPSVSYQESSTFSFSHCTLTLDRIISSVGKNFQKWVSSPGFLLNVIRVCPAPPGWAPNQYVRNWTHHLSSLLKLLFLQTSLTQ